MRKEIIFGRSKQWKPDFYWDICRERRLPIHMTDAGGLQYLRKAAMAIWRTVFCEPGHQRKKVPKYHRCCVCFSLRGFSCSTAHPSDQTILVRELMETIHTEDQLYEFLLGELTRLQMDPVYLPGINTKHQLPAQLAETAAEREARHEAFLATKKLVAVRQEHEIEHREFLRLKSETRVVEEALKRYQRDLETAQSLIYRQQTKIKKCVLCTPKRRSRSMQASSIKEQQHDR